MGELTFDFPDATCSVGGDDPAVQGFNGCGGSRAACGCRYCTTPRKDWPTATAASVADKLRTFEMQCAATHTCPWDTFHRFVCPGCDKVFETEEDVINDPDPRGPADASAETRAAGMKKFQQQHRDSS